MASRSGGGGWSCLVIRRGPRFSGHREVRAEADDRDCQADNELLGIGHCAVPPLHQYWGRCRRQEGLTAPKSWPRKMSRSPIKVQSVPGGGLVRKCGCQKRTEPAHLGRVRLVPSPTARPVWCRSEVSHVTEPNQRVSVEPALIRLPSRGRLD